MKLIVTAFVAITTMLSTQLHATVTVNHEPHSAPVRFVTPNEPGNTASFSIRLDRQGMDKRVRLSIYNPGRKNLHVSLNGPDGSAIDDFFTGRKTPRLNKTYNFSIAEAGLYSIEVHYGNERIKKQISLEYSGERPVDKLTIEQ
jgi:hypothetical protein